MQRYESSKKASKFKSDLIDCYHTLQTINSSCNQSKRSFSMMNIIRSLFGIHLTSVPCFEDIL